MKNILLILLLGFMQACGLCEYDGCYGYALGEIRDYKNISEEIWVEIKFEGQEAESCRIYSERQLECRKYGKSSFFVERLKDGSLWIMSKEEVSGLTEIKVYSIENEIKRIWAYYKKVPNNASLQDKYETDCKRYCGAFLTIKQNDGVLAQ